MTRADTTWRTVAAWLRLLPGVYVRHRRDTWRRRQWRSTHRYLITAGSFRWRLRTCAQVVSYLRWLYYRERQVH